MDDDNLEEQETMSYQLEYPALMAQEETGEANMREEIVVSTLWVNLDNPELIFKVKVDSFTEGSTPSHLAYEQDYWS